MATFPTQPSLQKHHDARSWTSLWRDDAGHQHCKRFGREGEISARQARMTFQRWVEQEWKPRDSVRNPGGVAAKYTCTRLAAQFLRHAHRRFRKHGRPTSHVLQVRYAMRALRDHSGGTMAEFMESPNLAALRDWMIEGEKLVRRRDPATGKCTMQRETYKRSVTTVNGRLLIIKEAFGWAREKGRVPHLVALDLASVKPLTIGRTDARDPRKVPPIAIETVRATLPHCSAVVAAMITANVYTGARPGEICIMRPCDLETWNPTCWIYTPESHKTEHKGIERKIALGPRAIEAVRPFLEKQKNLQAYLFSPAEAREERNAARRAEFEAKRAEKNVERFPSQVARLAAKRPADPERMPGGVYSEESYRKAIHYACRKAGIAPWNPNQLRHTHGTEVRKVFGLAGLKDAGLEAARETLGHQDTRTTEGYAKESLERAMEIARRVG